METNPAVPAPQRAKRGQALKPPYRGDAPQPGLKRTVLGILPGTAYPPKALFGDLFVPRQRGVALIIVLALVVVLTLLIVGLLASSQSERRLTASRFHSADARLGADSALGIVQGQLRRAAEQGIDPTSGQGVLAWASQPGAVRVYDDKGDEREILKLYSSAEMIVSGNTALDWDAEDMDGWEGRPDEFVDLNEPVRSDGEWIYPIASPDALGTVVGFDSSLSNSGGEDGPDDRLVMPVRWLYVLEDGTVTADPEEGDPYLRLAFWTDDESSKINLNTASASDADSYWDMPRTTYKDDRDVYAERQPSENEFNRYPGHPAGVNLRTVFPGSTVEEIIRTTPRYEWGGSENGTLPMSAATDLPNTKSDRLYATPDEFLYAPDRTAQLGLDAPALDTRKFFLTTSSRSSDLNLFGQPRVTIWPISGIDRDSHRTVYDRAIAFNSTLGFGTSSAKPYYFLRSDPNSQTADWDLYPRNQEVFEYLRTLTSRNIPGFGGNFEEKYNYGGVTGERDQILTEMFDYIRTVNLNETYKARNDDLSEDFVSYTNDRVSADSAADPYLRPAMGAGWVLPIVTRKPDGTPYGRGAGRVPVISEIGFWFIQTQDATDKKDEKGNIISTTYSDPDPPEVQPALLIETFSPMNGIMQWLPFNFSYRVTSDNPPRINGQPMFPAEAEYRSTWQGPSSAGWSRSEDTGGTDGFAWLMSGGYKNYINRLRDAPLVTRKSDAIQLPPPTPGAPDVTEFNIQGGEITIEFMTSPDTGTVGEGDVFQTYTIEIPDATVPVPGAVEPEVPDPEDPEEYPSEENRKVMLDGWKQRKRGAMPPTFHLNDKVIGLPMWHGDFRTTAYMTHVPEEFFEDTFASNHGFRTKRNLAHYGAESGSYVSNLNHHEPNIKLGDPDGKNPYYWMLHWQDAQGSRPKIPGAIDGLVEEGWDADFDNGMADHIDGPYLNKSDEGAVRVRPTGRLYYYPRAGLAEGFFSPFRQVPSAVVFGSLPTGVKHVEAGGEDFWRTLAFSPNPLSGAGHYGLSDPPDHLLLDLFTMPIVEPYAISEPFSTAGRLNLNRKLAPFTHITRDTALHAALASEKIIAIADDHADTYKTTLKRGLDIKVRFAVDAEETLKALDDYLADEEQELFRSASEICGVYLVPEGRTAADVAQWWDTRRLTGNNSREKPYSTLYPLLTTRSNVFTMHVRAQSIERLPSGRIEVKAEYRGSMLFERYLDPNDPIFTGDDPDVPVVDPDAVSLEPWFRFRTLNTKQFDP